MTRRNTGSDLLIPGLDDPTWMRAFAEIPRELFVPYYFTQRPDGRGWRLIEAPDPAWLAGVHSNDALTTQLDGDDRKAEAARRGEPVDGTPTSSSSAPELMAAMLQGLDVYDYARVLEIGTGTGYNTALLCHRVGADRVTSVDIDEVLIRRARQRLTGLAYAPHLRTGDGTEGRPDRAPLDRIIATVALRRVPNQWLAQTAPGGKIVCPLDLNGSGGLLSLLTVRDTTSASGNFLPNYGGFMSLRANQRTPVDAMERAEHEPGKARTTDLAADTVIDASGPVEFFMALRLGGIDHLVFTPVDGGPEESWLTDPHGAWACHTTDTNGRYHVRQGPGRLWDRIEDAHREWHNLGRPSRERFGLSVERGVHTIWLDAPTGKTNWLMPI